MLLTVEVELKQSLPLLMAPTHSYCGLTHCPTHRHTLTLPAVSSRFDKGQRDFRTATGHVVPPTVKCSDHLAASSAVTHIHKHTQMSLTQYTNLSVFGLLTHKQSFE